MRTMASTSYSKVKNVVYLSSDFHDYLYKLVLKKIGVLYLHLVQLDNSS